MKLGPGDSVGRYQLLTELSLGEGGNCMSAQAGHDGKRYFVKQFMKPKYPLGLGTPSGIEQGRAEFTAFAAYQDAKLNRISHIAKDGGRVGIPSEQFRQDSFWYVVTPLVDTAGLLSVAAIAALPKRETLRIMANVAAAVQALHVAGVVHGDLKPENIMITRAGREFQAKLIDFDSSYFDADPPDSDYLMGDQPYYSPELLSYMQRRAAPTDITTKSDVFALGIVFAEYLTGERPPTGGFQYLCETVRAGVLAPLPGIEDARLAALISSMLQMDWRVRPSVGEVFASLKRSLRDAADTGPAKVTEPPRDMKRFNVQLPSPLPSTRPPSPPAPRPSPPFPLPAHPARKPSPPTPHPATKPARDHTSTRDPQVRFAPLIYACFCALALVTFTIVGSQNLAQVATTGPDDPSHAKTTGIPANVMQAAETSLYANSLSSKLSGQLKAVEDVDRSSPAAGGLPPIWIVYEAGQQAPPPRFAWMQNIAIAVDGDTGQQLSPDSFPKEAPFSRLGRSGSWQYLGAGFDGFTVQVQGLVLAFELAAIYALYWSRRQRLVAHGSHLAWVRLFTWLVALPFVLVIVGQLLFGIFVVYLVTVGDPVARGILEVVPAAALIAPVLARTLGIHKALLPRALPKSARTFAIPWIIGFRSGTPWKMALASIVYLALLVYGALAVLFVPNGADRVGNGVYFVVGFGLIALAGWRRAILRGRLTEPWFPIPWPIGFRSGVFWKMVVASVAYWLLLAFLLAWLFAEFSLTNYGTKGVSAVPGTTTLYVVLAALIAASLASWQARLSGVLARGPRAATTSYLVVASLQNKWGDTAAVFLWGGVLLLGLDVPLRPIADRYNFSGTLVGWGFGFAILAVFLLIPAIFVAWRRR